MFCFLIMCCFLTAVRQQIIGEAWGDLQQACMELPVMG